MSLAERMDEMEQAEAKPCKYARIIEELRKVDKKADEFDEKVMARAYSGTAAAEALTLEGHPIGDTVLRKHVARKCCCFR